MGWQAVYAEQSSTCLQAGERRCRFNTPAAATALQALEWGDNVVLPVVVGVLGVVLSVMAVAQQVG